jgi:hypothetical protein
VANPSDDTIVEVDIVAANFCKRLTLAWITMRERMQPEVDQNQQLLTIWEVRNRVDNPNPLGIRGLMGSLAAPQRTFRYGASPIVGLTVTVPRVSFSVSQNHRSKFRTPEEQAVEVAKGKDASQVCWGAHMSNMARHIIPTVDGKPLYDGGEFEKRLGSYFPAFNSLWVNELRHNGLRDAGGGCTWFNNPKFKDELHVELPNAKFGQSDHRAAACVDEYARLLKKVPGSVKNDAFEDNLDPPLELVLKNALEKYSH